MKLTFIVALLSSLTISAQAETAAYKEFQKKNRSELIAKLRSQPSFAGKFYYDYTRRKDKKAGEMTNIQEALFENTRHKGALDCSLEIVDAENGSIDTAILFPNNRVSQEYTQKIETDSKYISLINNFRNKVSIGGYSGSVEELIIKEKMITGQTVYTINGDIEKYNYHCLVGLDCFPNTVSESKYTFDRKGKLINVSINVDASIFGDSVVSCSVIQKSPDYTKTLLNGFYESLNENKQLEID
ncbi:MAG: hypothetical protein K2Q18_15585 [Bdellovibrionales bacterium]|nr:hypothetical protein [Bdellovibrionales bacterium]